MDYQKTIETHINECKRRIDVIRRHVNTNGDADTDRCFENIKVLETAISALKELQAIHNNGISLERLKDIDFRKQVVEHINYMEYVSVKDELEEFKQLGTLDEVRGAVEKQRKVKPEDGEYCPICHTFLKDEDDVPGFYCMIVDRQ